MQQLAAVAVAKTGGTACLFHSSSRRDQMQIANCDKLVKLRVLAQAVCSSYFNLS
jgi:hypothetical protein